MAIIWDEAKDAINRAKHGLGFADFAGFDGAPAVRADNRPDYEGRYQARGFVAGERRMIAFTFAGGNLRLISYRAAHEKEFQRHGLE